MVLSLQDGETEEVRPQAALHTSTSCWHFDQKAPNLPD